jgi:hypothetical protein
MRYSAGFFMSEELPRFKIFIRLLHPFPEDKAEEYPNLAQSRVRLTIRQVGTERDVRDWSDSQYRHLVENTLDKGIKENPDYFPLDPELTGEIGFDITVWDRKQGEMTGVLFKDEEMDIPDKYLDN